jgi:hypothetical protein
LCGEVAEDSVSDVEEVEVPIQAGIIEAIDAAVPTPAGFLLRLKRVNDDLRQLLTRTHAAA